MTKKIDRRKMLKLGAPAVVAPVVATVVISQAQAGGVRVASPAQKLLNERRSAMVILNNADLETQRWDQVYFEEYMRHNRFKPWTG